jgi:hypothetical protein
MVSCGYRSRRAANLKNSYLYHTFLASQKLISALGLTCSGCFSPRNRTTKQFFAATTIAYPEYGTAGFFQFNAEPDIGL